MDESSSDLTIEQHTDTIQSSEVFWRARPLYNNGQPWSDKDQYFLNIDIKRTAFYKQKHKGARDFRAIRKPNGDIIILADPKLGLSINRTREPSLGLAHLKRPYYKFLSQPFIESVYFGIRWDCDEFETHGVIYCKKDSTLEELNRFLASINYIDEYK